MPCSTSIFLLAFHLSHSLQSWTVAVAFSGLSAFLAVLVQPNLFQSLILGSLALTLACHAEDTGAAIPNATPITNAHTI